jgi:selenocysteine lyase/cysteine desulfurase
MINQKNRFSLTSDVTYLNCAYMSPILKDVEKAGIEGIKAKRNPAGVSPKEFFSTTEKVREQFAKLININERNKVVIIPSASYGLATVAKNLKAGKSDNIIITAEQFPSNVYPWLQFQKENGVAIKSISPPDVLEGRGKKWNEKILDAINAQTKMVAIGNVHWADGTLFNLEEIRKRTKEVGALLVIDGTQSVGALPFDIQKIQPDALICAGYKWLLGPYSIGLAYYGNHFDNGKPIEENWINRLHSENFPALVNYQDQYQPGSLRYEVGEHSNFILVPMLLAALKQINQWKPKNIQNYCDSISRNAIHKLQESGFWIEEENFRSKHLFGVRLPSSKDIEKLKLKLRKNKISVSIRGNAIRISPHVYNTEKDLLKLVQVLT